MDERQNQDFHNHEMISLTRHQLPASQSPSRCHPWVFIGGIPRQVNREEIFCYVKQFGQLKYFALPYNKEDRDNHKGFAKALFENAEETAAFLNFPNHLLHGVSIGVSEWKPKKEHISKKEVPSENKLFFKFRQLPTEKELLGYFSQFGTIDSIEMKFNYKTNQIRDFGFVIFEQYSSTQRALSKGSHHLVAGKRLMVFNSKSKRDYFKEKLNSNILQSKTNSSEDHQVASYKKPDCAHSQEALDCINCNTCSIGSINSLKKDIKSQERPISNMIPHQRMKCINECFLKPTSKRWHHTEVNIRHNIQTNLCFRQLALREHN